jgi:hypothetical protein
MLELLSFLALFFSGVLAGGAIRVSLKKLGGSASSGEAPIHDPNYRKGGFGFGPQTDPKRPPAPPPPPLAPASSPQTSSFEEKLSKSIDKLIELARREGYNAGVEDSHKVLETYYKQTREEEETSLRRLPSDVLDAVMGQLKNLNRK